MIQQAGKYTPVQTSARPAHPGGRGSGRPAARMTSAMRMAAGPGPASAGKTPHLFIPRLQSHPQLLMDWWWKEIREGGFFYEYLRRERDSAPARFRSVARQHEARGPLNYKTEDVRHVCSVPARDYFRLKQMDPNFFEDKKNLKLLKKYNPDAVVTP